ncbi:MAG: cytochrome d ubiquinol oxidase subunit II [Prevotellaceae bacterium]|jgi:cytochrome d ubiquinol oxidase subunit II|nr:cytochrome d ubiquinol oxidase subunit II [Prevotellaceae bacterium]
MDTTYIFLQHYWWFLVSLLGALFVFLMFVQGGQTLIYTLGKSEDEKTLIINTLGRKWEFTFTTLVTFGGAFFASFPLFYSTSFGGAYWVWMAILLCFVVQAVAYEYRTKANNFLGKKTYEIFLLINGFGATVLVGTAVGTLFTGANFSVNFSNLTNLGGNLTISEWHHPFNGLEAVWENPLNITLGLAVFFLARILGALYIINSVDNDNILQRTQKRLLYDVVPFLVFFLTFVICLLLKTGVLYDAGGNCKPEEYKYLKNFLQMPAILVTFLVGVVCVLWGTGKTVFSKPVYSKGIWFAGTGTVLTVLALLLTAGYNNTAYYPSNVDINSSLTIVNSSSSKFTLTAMSIVSIAIVFVLAYIFYFWRVMNRKKMTVEEIKSESHTY